MAVNFTPGNLIVCNGTTVPCTFDKLVLLANTLISDLVIISTLLATAVFIFAGFKLLTSGGNPSAMSDAKKMFMKVLIGYLWILAAWLVVYTITNTLLKGNYTILGAP